MLSIVGAHASSLFHTPTGAAYIDFLNEGHRETWPVRSKQFRNWLRRCFYTETGFAAPAAALKATVELLEAKAQFDAPERPINIRVAEHQGLIYLDLADGAWRTIEISNCGWRTIDAPPARFRRTAGMLALPAPERGGSIDKLRSFLNLASHDDFVLLVAWLLAALRPHGPYPLLVLAGEQGSAKTVLTKLLRALIDANAAPVRALPREERELMIAANNGHVLAFDNVSGLPPWLSDALCRLASGGSFAVRRLYTDDEEVLFEAARPIILNGIEDVITRPDLADRAIFLTLPPIPERERRPESELWRDFELARPGILGALLDAVSHGLRILSSTRVQYLPRMADFALWACACEGAFWLPDTFLKTYTRNRLSAIENAVDSDPLALFVRALMAERSLWIGTASELWGASTALANGAGTGVTAWPKNPRALAGRLRRSQTFLRSLGIEIEFSREGHVGNRTITISTASAMRRHSVSSVSTVSANSP
jgi:hypothetical protein